MVDEESWGHSTSIESLFGQLCSGTSFRYDEEMRSTHALIGAQRCKGSRLQKSTARDETAALKHHCSDEDACASSPFRLRASSPPTPSLRTRAASSNLYKRRKSPCFNRQSKVQRKHTTSPHKAPSRGEARELASSFLGWTESSQKVAICSKYTFWEPNADTPASVFGTRQNPVELSDQSGSEAESEGESGREVAISRPLDEAYMNTWIGGTQVSLSDSAFESQEPRPPEPSTGASPANRVQHRKEIYRAVKDDDGHVWGRTHGLFSTGSAHEDASELSSTHFT